MMQAITIVLTLASVVGSTSGFATSAPQVFGRPVTSLSMAKPAAKTPAAKATPSPVMADIVDTAVAAGSFKTLAAALGAADLVATLKSKGPFTVFAPTDEAFAKLPKGTVEDLLKPENKAKLAAILTYHVIAGEVMASTVVTMDGKSAATVNGASVKIGVKAGAVTVDGAKVVTTDIKTSNGVIHVIDSVLMPKPALADIVDTAVAAGSFKTLAAALGAAGLVDTLKGKGPFTVFAPTDEAFAKLPKGTVEDLLKPANKAKLAAILTYHVIAGEVMASTVVTMDGKTAATVNGKSVKIGVKGAAVTVDGAKVLTTDIKTSNGVIHIIDTVMIPK
jgi:transforming growth factor-beta-induced protein